MLGSGHPGLLWSGSGRMAYFLLSIHATRIEAGVSLEADPNLLAQCGVQPLPGSIQAELPEAVVDAAPRQEIVGKQTPRAGVRVAEFYHYYCLQKGELK